MQRRDWVAAARVLIRCVRILEQDEMRQIGAIYDIRIFLTDLHHVDTPSPPTHMSVVSATLYASPAAPLQCRNSTRG
jgi:hypothetical protein